MVEVQHANEGKNVLEVTADYLAADLSVFWADETDFSTDRFRVDRFDTAFESRDRAYAPYHDDPDGVLEDIDPSELSWLDVPDSWTLEDPRPDCTHEFEHQAPHPRCLRCGTPIEYIREIDQHAYGPPDSSKAVASSPQVGLRVQGNREHVLFEEPHIHLWEPYEDDENGRVDRCTRCQARRRNPPHVIIIDYEMP